MRYRKAMPEPARVIDQHELISKNVEAWTFQPLHRGVCEGDRTMQLDGLVRGFWSPRKSAAVGWPHSRSMGPPFHVVVQQPTTDSRSPSDACLHVMAFSSSHVPVRCELEPQ